MLPILKELPKRQLGSICVVFSTSDKIYQEQPLHFRKSKTEVTYHSLNIHTQANTRLCKKYLFA